MKPQSDFKKYAERTVSSLYENNDFQRIYERLCQIDPGFLVIKPPDFALEYLAARMALSTLVWEHACEENKIKDEAIQKLYLKEVMNSFQSPQFLNLATAFGDYLCPSGEDEAAPAVKIALHFFKRLSRAETVLTGPGQTKIGETFLVVMGAWEGFRTSFENEFFEFIHAE